MREKNFNTGLRGVLFEQRHYERMGSAIWLYGWLVLRQTHQSGTVGWVLGGTPISYREIEEETGFGRKALERWMRTLRVEGYIETEGTQRGITIRITKAKKFARPRLKNAEGGRNSAESRPQFRGGKSNEVVWKQQPLDGIGSSSVARLNDKELLAAICSEVRKQMEEKSANRSGLGQDENRKANPPQDWQQNQQQQFFYETRRRHNLLRAEREEAVRRELAVGTGPEVRRS